MNPVVPRTGPARRLLLQATAASLLSALGFAQPARHPFRIALLPDFMPAWDAWLQLLAQTLQGYGRVEGRDYVFYRSGVYYGDDTDRAVRLAVDAEPDLIYGTNLGYIVAAHQRTKTIPIVMWVSGFPVEGGVAESLVRPGKNVTGLTVYAGAEVFGKLVQLLFEIRPGLRRVAALHSYVPPFHPAAEARLIAMEMREGGRQLGVEVREFEIERPDQVDGALAAAAADRAEALLLTSGVSMRRRRGDIIRFAVDRILWRGANPAELPIQLPAKYEMVVNPRMAKAIGTHLPPAIVTRASRLIAG